MSMSSLMSRFHKLENDEERRRFEEDVDRFASNFVGARGKAPRGTCSWIHYATSTKMKKLRIGDLPPKERGHVRIVAISDTHFKHQDICVPPGDILVHAGDIFFLGGFYGTDTNEKRLRRFNAWMSRHPHRHKVVVGGNHDALLENMCNSRIRSILSECDYLVNESRTFGDSGSELVIFGSPLSAPNSAASPNMAFQGAATAKELQLALAGLNHSVDVLLIHGPPGTLDESVREFIRVRRPRLVIHGHVHETYGVTTLHESLVVNATTMGGTFSPVNPPVVVDLPLSKRQDPMGGATTPRL